MVISFKSVLRTLILIFLTLRNYLKRYGGDFSVNLGKISTSLVRIFFKSRLGGSHMGSQHRGRKLVISVKAVWLHGKVQKTV